MPQAAPPQQYVCMYICIIMCRLLGSLITTLLYVSAFKAKLSKPSVYMVPENLYLCNLKCFH